MNNERKKDKSLSELEKQRDERITKEGKPEVKISFLSAKELVNSKDPVGNKKVQKEIKENYKKLRQAIDRLWGEK